MQNISEPIICAVNIVNQPDYFERYLIDDENSFKGELVVHQDKVRNLKSRLYDSIAFKKIQLPYRYTLISCEIVYKNKHIGSVHLSGVYLSRITIPSGTPQLTVLKTPDPPITSIDDNGNFIVNSNSKRKMGDTYFIAHWSENNAYINWSLKDNAEILSNAEKYSHITCIKLGF